MFMSLRGPFADNQNCTIRNLLVQRQDMKGFAFQTPWQVLEICLHIIALIDPNSIQGRSLEQA